MFLVRVYDKLTKRMRISSSTDSLEEAAYIASQKGLLDDRFYCYGDVYDEERDRSIPRHELQEL